MKYCTILIAVALCSSKPAGADDAKPRSEKQASYIKAEARGTLTFDAGYFVSIFEDADSFGIDLFQCKRPAEGPVAKCSGNARIVSVGPHRFGGASRLRVEGDL